ncbi:MAG TPA: hypothetical protein VH087_08570 [Thermoanaerobaculia bacterium]|jgi:hypothetical protein|nr:hypothetical protein [Thermoanaerobaculia bacterium]
MPQLVFLTFLLGLTTGKATVSLQADASIASIRLELGGRSVATMTQAPWSADVDFGPELIPQRLVAIGYAADGREIARTSQDVNLPRGAVEVEILLQNENGQPARAKLVARSRKHVEPAQTQLSLDGEPLPVGADLSAGVPQLDWRHPHVLSAVVTFRDGEVARSETIVAGGLGQNVSSDLTPVAVAKDRRKSDPQTLGGCFALDGAPVRANALEPTNPLVIVVKNPAYELPPTNRSPGAWWFSPLAREYRLDADTSVRILWATPEQYAARGEPTYSLFPPTIDFSATQFGMAWLVTRAPAPPPNGPKRFADAVGVAGLAAYQSGRRRAVVLLLDESPDLSLHSPEVVRRYLDRLGVPLFVWSIGKFPSRGWGNVVDITSRYNLTTAVDAVKDALSKQRIVWVATDPLASLRIEGNDRCGLKPLAAPATKPDANRRPAS